MKRHHAKIGTHSTTVVVVDGRTRLKVGARVKFKEVHDGTPVRNLKWSTGRITSIEDDGRLFIERE